MGKQIAILMGSVNMGNQKRMLEGMIDAAKAVDCNLFVFTCNIRFDEKEETKKAACHIMKLPDFQYFDGVIIVQNTIQHEATAREVVSAIRESGIPAVSIDCELSGMDYIRFMHYEAECEIVRHLVEVHGCRDICYVAGPSFGKSADEGLRACKEVLTANGIVFDEKNVIKGFWNDTKGRRIAEEFLEQRGCPEAIVCANDLMAIEVLEVLKKYDYRVPQDVRVACFDSGKMSMLLSPPLTTVDVNLYAAGKEAVFSVTGHKKGEKPKHISIPFRPVFRESCGCLHEDDKVMDEVDTRHLADEMHILKLSDILKSMISDFTEVEKPEELIEVLKTYVLEMGMDSFYLCLCDKNKIFGSSSPILGNQVNLHQVSTDYTDKMAVPLAYENGEFRFYKEFSKGMVLPEKCRNRHGSNFYVAVPIHYQQNCFGYCVSGNSRFPIDESLYYLWMINIGIGLENIRKLMLLQATVDRLDKVWAYDMLTQLYNRAGFLNAAAALFEELYVREAEAFLVFMDIDGLKMLNDTRGHEMGDLLIGTVAQIIQNCINQGELAMRYGGDEFVVVGEQRDERMEKLISKIRTEMDTWNQAGKEITVSASIGSMTFVVERTDDINKYIEQADKRMYQEKRKKRRESSNPTV